MKEQVLSPKNQILQMIIAEEEEPHAHKPFMNKVPVKATPIGFQFHQINIPEFIPQTALKPSSQRKIKWGDKEIDRSLPVFLKSRVDEDELMKYLSFLENYLEEKVPDYFLQTNHKELALATDSFMILVQKKNEESVYLVSRQRTRSMSLQLLHQSGYNYTKAKFYILFPYYKTYNQYKCHQPLILSNSEMEHKIKVHIQSLKSNKENDLIKWVKTIENQMESRIHVSKINTYMQIARQNKYEIPDSIKELIDKSVRISKDIKKNVLNSKNSFEKLLALKHQLQQDHKIVTNQMIHFEEAVTRAEEWIKKQIKFQEQYFQCEECQNQQTILTLKSLDFFQQFGKIQYRILQSLVSQYNSLPLNFPSFAKTTQILFEETNKLINKLPSLSKAAKTRKSEQGNGVMKISRKVIYQILNDIKQIPVDHEDFANFEYSITDGLEQLQRISMFLEDSKFQKNLKSLYQYQKLLVDIPVQNDAQKKLNEKIQYYELIDRIRKDISNPQKYETLKDLIFKLKEKGYENLEHAKLEIRVITCMGWHDSQQFIREEKKIPNRTFMIFNEKIIRSKMIKYETFQAQLLSARNELNIPDDILKQSEQRLDLVKQLRDKILDIVNEKQPSLGEYLSTFKACYENGISFFEFQDLYQKLSTILIIMAKMHYLLNTSDEMSLKFSEFYFTSLESQKICEFICEKKHEIKDLRTKQTGDQIIAIVNNMNFPQTVAEWKIFQEFMKKAQEWSDKAINTIEEFKNNILTNVKEIIEEARHCLHSKFIEEELDKIQIALKWRQKIQRKITDENIFKFDQEHVQFIEKLEKDLQKEQQNFGSHEEMMERALQYMHENGGNINSMLEEISAYPIDKVIVLKLSQMNKFVKEIDREIERYQIKDKVIDQLKEQLQIQLVLSQDWKERYLAIKRFQKKKIGQTPVLKQLLRKKDDDEMAENQICLDYMKDEKEQQNHDFYIGGYIPKAMMVSYSPSLLSRPQQLTQSQKKKYIIKNGQFCWYFRMLLMLFEFYNGCKLKFVVEEFIKLKNSLTEVHRLIEKYNVIYEKSERSDLDFQYLESQTCKIPIFFKESYLITNKYAQIQAWRNIAEHVLKSVPVINMEVKARKPEELRELLEKRKNQELLNQNRIIDEQINENNSKRKRKPNQLYENDQITIFRDDLLISKTKKKRNLKSHLLSHNFSLTDDYRSHKKPKSEKQYNLKEDKESLQRIDQLLNGGNLELMIQDPKTYCICRNGILNENSLMVQCEECKQWYHIECVGIKKHQAKSEQQYLCVGCKNLRDQDGRCGYFWDHHQKITEYALIELYNEGVSMHVSLPELHKISLLYKAMLKWKEQTNNLLGRIIEENTRDVSQYIDEIYPLYLNSLWLPTIHYQAVHLKQLMKYIRSL